MVEPKFHKGQRVRCFQPNLLPDRNPPYAATIVWCRTQHARIRLRGRGDHTVNVGTLAKR